MGTMIESDYNLYVEYLQGRSPTTLQLKYPEGTVEGLTFYFNGEKSEYVLGKRSFVHNYGDWQLYNTGTRHTITGETQVRTYVANLLWEKLLLKIDPNIARTVLEDQVTRRDWNEVKMEYEKWREEARERKRDIEMQKRVDDQMREARLRAQNLEEAMNTLNEVWKTKLAMDEDTYAYEITKKIKYYELDGIDKENEHAIAVEIARKKKSWFKSNPYVYYATIALVYDKNKPLYSYKYYVNCDGTFQQVHCHFTLDSEIQWQLEKVKYIVAQLHR